MTDLLWFLPSRKKTKREQAARALKNFNVYLHSCWLLEPDPDHLCLEFRGIGLGPAYCIKCGQEFSDPDEAVALAAELLDFSPSWELRSMDLHDGIELFGWYPVGDTNE